VKLKTLQIIGDKDHFIHVLYENLCSPFSIFSFLIIFYNDLLMLYEIAIGLCMEAAFAVIYYIIFLFI